MLLSPGKQHKNFTGGGDIVSERKMISYTRKQRWKIARTAILRDKLLYVMLIPGVLWFILFKYVPMYGITIAFRDYNIFQGFSNAPWAGFSNFHKLFSLPAFWDAFNNTIILSIMKLFCGFPVPILLSLMINEIRNVHAKKLVQTVVLLPNFISWVVISAIMYALFSVNSGAIKALADMVGYSGKMTNFMQYKGSFRWVLVISDIWKSAGYGTIVYLGVMTSIDPTLYEAAEIDGASWLQKIWHVTLPGMRPSIIILLIFRLGAMLNVGFEQIFVLSNPLVAEVAEVLDTYVYKVGMTNRQYTTAMAASLLKALIGMVLVFSANFVANKIEPDSGIM